MKKKKPTEYIRKVRGTWFGVNPVTKVLPNKKKYDRKKLKQKLRKERCC